MTGLIRRLRGLLGRSPAKAARAQIYEGVDYLDGYVAHTEARVAADPRSAIGGRWEEIGELQFAFLKAEGLRPDQRLLDLGCGTLRGGRHFIRYLDPGGYTGIDIAPACIAAAERLVVDEGLADRRPRLILNETRRMDFAQVADAAFDVILAQSVFTHLPGPIIAECFANVGRCMAPDAAFYFTFREAETETRSDEKEFAHPWAFFEGLAAANGFVASDCSARYPHPRGQRMGRVSRVAR